MESTQVLGATEAPETAEVFQAAKLGDPIGPEDKLVTRIPGYLGQKIREGIEDKQGKKYPTETNSEINT